MPGAGFGLRGMSRSRRGRGEVLPGRRAWRGTAEWVRDPRRGPETKRELPVCAAAPQRDPQGSLWPPLHRALRPQPWSQWLRPGEATLAGGLSFCAPENLILGPDLVPADPSPHRLSLARTLEPHLQKGLSRPWGRLHIQAGRRAGAGSECPAVGGRGSTGAGPGQSPRGHCRRGPSCAQAGRKPGKGLGTGEALHAAGVEGQWR